MPCIHCGQHVTAPANMHFDHVDPSTKQFRMQCLFTTGSAMSNKPSEASFAKLRPAPGVNTVYKALLHEIKKLAMTCAICHAKKSFAELEIAMLKKLGKTGALH